MHAEICTCSAVDRIGIDQHPYDEGCGVYDTDDDGAYLTQCRNRAEAERLRDLILARWEDYTTARGDRWELFDLIDELEEASRSFGGCTGSSVRTDILGGMKNTSESRIQDISNVRDAKEEAKIRYTAGNDAGDGYAWEDRDDVRIVVRAENDTEVSVYALPDGSEVAVGGSNGPWAVTITRADREAAPPTPRTGTMAR